MVSAESVYNTVYEAFKSVSYPGDDGIGEMQHSPSDGRDIAIAFRGKHWLEVTPQALREHASLVGFTPEALHFYLPAYLLGGIDYPDIVNLAIDNTVWSLNPENHANTSEFEKLFRTFTKEQKQAIVMFLSFLHERQGAYMQAEILSALQFWNEEAQD